MRITSKGQVTIPVEVREQAGLHPDLEVDIVFRDGVATIVKATGDRGSSRGARIVARMRGRGDSGLSTDEIMAMTRGED
jgi:AbrB family looped-hinge helix DNA binding protein